MGKDDFVATEGWFHRWKKRENISFVKPHGEQGEADQVAARSWINSEWPSLIAKYLPSCVSMRMKLDFISGHYLSTLTRLKMK